MVGPFAKAQPTLDWNRCAGQGNPTPEQRAQACTAIIESQTESPAGLAKAYGNRGIAYQNKSDAAAAIRDYDQSLALDSISASSHRFSGNKYLIQGQSDRAITEFDEAIRLEPTAAVAFNGRGLSHRVKKEYDQALADFNEAIRLDPNYAVFLANRASVYRAKGEDPRAIADYDRAIELDPQNYQALIGRGGAYVAKKEYDRAVADFNEAIRLRPEAAASFLARAFAYNAKGDTTRAIADYDQAIRLDPKDARVFISRGSAYYATKEYDRAIADYTQAATLDSKNISAFYSRGAAYYAKREYDLVVADYSEAIQLDPKNAKAFVARGLAYRDKGSLPPAIADYDQAIKIDPGYAAAFANRCNTRITVGQDLKAALSDCNESLRLQPSQAFAFSSRGFAYLKLGSTGQAIADFNAALANDPKDAWSLYGRGLAKSKAGDASGADVDVTAAGKIRSNLARGIAKYYGVTAEPDFASRLARASAKENPMIFVIAEGGPDACGSGCNQWIAADGAVDPDAEKRFRKFLGTLNGRKLPIFFNSTGGSLLQSFAIGRILRERKMLASVGVTFPEGCAGDAVDPSCRQMMRSSTALKARLRFAGAICHSGCVYALMGGSVRQIPPGTLLGVHATARTLPPNARATRSMAQTDELFRIARRRYTQQMGVNPELVDFADKTPYVDLHLLSRDEIARFRMETTQH